MRWRKLGRVFVPEQGPSWMQSHAQIPTPLLDEGQEVLRVFFATRDGQGRSRTAFVELDGQDPTRVCAVSEQPVIDIGPPGSHDDSGAMPFCVVPVNGTYYFYYTGWNQPKTVSYLLSIGLCEGDGKKFHKRFSGPLWSRSPQEPYWVAAPCVHHCGDAWRMWYISCHDWLDIDGKLEPVYCVKHARSDDGVRWVADTHICVGDVNGEEAIGRPWVIRDGELYRMWFSYRGSRGYRDAQGQHYRIGYAESVDGIHWKRMDEAAGIDVSDRGWDSEMVEYCSIVDMNDKRYMLYNGNGFGRSGFGLAVLEED